MNNNILPVLAAIAILTSLTVEGLKKILNERQKKYSSNILAVVVSFLITVAGSVMYIIYNSIPITPQVIVMIVALVFLAFLCSTVGYDKVIQALRQIKGE